ncbi:hypothetical protein PG988_001185 [Apiospora saccharicola]
MAVLRLTNVDNNETVHQRCLLVTGTCDDANNNKSGGEDFVAVTIRDAFSKASEPQNWPVAGNAFRCLLMLQPGPNTVDFKLYGSVAASARLTVNYQPLLQLPPLNLAILVAKDSPLMIDCPPVKRGAITSAHSTLEAAISKLRMTAYMWQALLAEEFRSMNLGRRSFRLDEQWETDTITTAHLQCDAGETIAGSVAKVHIVRSDKTVAELRDPQVAQQNHYGNNRNMLDHFFEQTLRSYGTPFTSSTRPVVAGLVLDSHYSVNKSMILAHAAQGKANPTGLSLGMFGSHLTCSWPRYLEEIPACLLDRSPTGDAFGDEQTTKSERESPVTVRCVLDSEDNISLEAKCLAGLAMVRFKDNKGNVANDLSYYKLECRAGLDGGAIRPPTVFHMDQEELEATYDRSKKWSLEVIGMNGNLQTISNIWALLADQPFVKVPNSSLVLTKRSVKSREVDLEARGDQFCQWATLLRRKYGDGSTSRLTYANRIDLRIGAIMDGAVVYFSDGTKCNLGQANQTSYGGHQAEDRTLSEEESLDIRKVSVSNARSGWGGTLCGCRMTLASGERWGAINSNQARVQHLEAQPDERIIGFYGRSQLGNGFTAEFGIITAPKRVVDSDEGLPRQIYDMPELQNLNDVGSNEWDGEDNDDDDEDEDDDDDDDDEDEDEDEDEDMDD